MKKQSLIIAAVLVIGSVAYLWFDWKRPRDQYFEKDISTKPSLAPISRNKSVLRDTGGQAVSAGPKQIASIGTVEKRKRVSGGLPFVSSLISRAYAQEDSRLIAYISSFIQDSYIGDIFTYDLSSGEKTKIAASGGEITVNVVDKKSGEIIPMKIQIGFGRPTIAEKTNKLVFIEYDKGPSDAYSDGMKVHLYDFGVGSTEMIGEDGRGHASPRFSRDGKTLAYFNKLGQIVLYNIESRKRRVVPLTAAPLDQYIVFSGDDSKIYYASIDFSTLYELSLISEQSRKIIELPLKSDGFNDFIVFPSVSENGLEINYFQLKRSQFWQSYNFVVLNLNGEELRRFSIPQKGVESYYVSAERQKVYYASASDGGLFELNLSTGSSKLLVPAISTIIGRGTSPNEIIVMKFPSAGLAEFRSYNLDTSEQKKLFDNQ